MGTKSTDYKRKFTAENYDRIEITVKKGAKENIKLAAQTMGTTVNNYIKQAVQTKYEADTGDKIEL